MILGLCIGAGLLAAQAPPPRGPGRPGGPDLFGPRAEQRLTRVLGLSAEQQNKVHTALQEQQVQSRGLADQAAALRGQLAVAVRAGDEAKIDQTTQDLARLNQQQAAIRAKTLAKIYGSLTADQKTQVEGMLDRTLGVPRARVRRAPPAPVQQQ
jgi:Spy/CpxP family protein refolding chaperone